MPLYSYTAKSQEGEVKTGEMEVKDKHELARLLRDDGYILISSDFKYRKKRQFSIDINAFISNIKGVSLVEKMNFTRNLSVMIGAGLPIIDALSILSEQTKNTKFKNTILDISGNIQKGFSLGDSFSIHKNVFSDLFVNMIKVGEASGKLEEVLKILENQMRKEYELKSKIKGAMMYPSVIVIAMIGIGILEMIMVVPKLAETFEELNAELPIATKIVIYSSDIMAKYWMFVIIAALGVVYLLRIFFRTSRGKAILDAVMINFPLFGGLIRKVNSARFSRIMSSLTEAGVSMIKSLDITSKTLTNKYYRDSLSEAEKEVEKGRDLSESLRKYKKLYPSMVTEMIKVGEKTGTIGEVLARVADFYEEQVTNITKNLATIIEPVLMVIIGAVVGFFAISMIQPIYSMMGNI